MSDPMTVEQAEKFLRQQFLDDTFLQFIRALDEAGWLLGDVTNDLSPIIYLLEKPWKWTSEFLRWDAAGRPMDDSEPGWEQFAHEPIEGEGGG